MSRHNHWRLDKKVTRNQGPFVVESTWRNQGRSLKDKENFLSLLLIPSFFYQAVLWMETYFCLESTLCQSNQQHFNVYSKIAKNLQKQINKKDAILTLNVVNHREKSHHFGKFWSKSQKQKASSQVLMEKKQQEIMIET